MSVVVAVGSTNPVKVAAVRQIFEQAFPGIRTISLDVPSGVPDQPLGEEETLRGAVARARAALESGGADFGAGIEAGVVLEGERAWMMGYTAIAARDGTVSWSRGIQFLLPPAVAEAVRAGREVGPVMDEVSGIHEIKKKGGTVGFLTEGLLDRTSALAMMVAAALPPHLHPDLYRKD